MKVRTFNFLICGLLVAGMIIAADLPSVPEQFTGRIVDVGQAVRGAGSTYFTVHIDSYTTDEKVQELATLLACWALVAASAASTPTAANSAASRDIRPKNVSRSSLSSTLPRV